MQWPNVPWHCSCHRRSNSTSEIIPKTPQWRLIIDTSRPTFPVEIQPRKGKLVSDMRDAGDRLQKASQKYHSIQEVL